jgi:hypothetical protein
MNIKNIKHSVKNNVIWFVMYYGVLCWALPVFIIMQLAYFAAHLFSKNFFTMLFDQYIIMSLIIWLICGIVFGLVMWFLFKKLRINSSE